MKKLFVLLLLCFCLTGIGFAQNTSVIDPELYALMNSKSGEKISINIILKKQIDANKLNLRKSYSSKTAMRNSMVEELKYQAEKSQADIVKTLTASERSAQVTDVKTHWLTNMINCNATADVIYKIAEHPDVEAIIYNKMEYLLFDEKATQGTPTRAYNGTNVEKINAHKVWQMGYTGEGVVVAVIDTGVNADHVDLKDHLWNDGNGNHGWNTLANSSNVADGDGHGTHCAGTVCGDGTSGTITGMAPDAKLMAVKALSDSGQGTLESLIAGIEYATEKGADVLSMSLGFSYPSAYTGEAMRNALVNTLPLGIVVAAAAGNDGKKQSQYPTPRNINAPGNCPPPWIHPDQQSNEGGRSSVICVGAVNYQDVSCDFSSEGPVTWQNTSYGDYGLAAGYPTKNIRYDNSDYTGSWGTNKARTFGVMFPPSMLTEFANGGIVTSVSIHSGLGDSGFMTIYNGGNTPDDASATALHTQGYAYNPDGEMYDIVLDKEVQIDVNKNLWVIFESYLDGNPIPVASNTDNPNGRWVKVNGTWTNNHSEITEMIKIHVSISTSNEAEEEKIGLIRPDVCAPGYDIMSASNIENEWYKWISGTSMATPCVAGAIALLLQAKPSLTPAQICEVLETTAVKLSDTKSNRTGTGRIDVYEALLALSDTELVAPTLTATAASSSAINLSWTKSSSATYTVYRDGTSIATVSGTSYTDTGLNPDTQYCYQVKAVKGSESKTSNEVCARTYEEGAAIAGKYRIKVSTSSHADYGKYLHINNTTAPGSSTNVGVSAYAESDNQIFTIESADGGNYYLRSENGYYIKCGTTNLGKYWNVYAYSATEKTPIYFDYPDANKNNFYIRDNDKMTGANHSSSMVNNSYFKVEDSNIFCDADINGYHQTSGIKQTVTWTLELVGSSTPTAPNAPTALATSVKGSSSIALTWDAVNGATSYNVYRNDTKIASNITATSYTDNGLTAATNYCYTVTAVNAVGESAESTSSCATTLAEGSAVEQEITIGGDVNANNTYNELPTNVYYNYTFSQQIYTKDEIGTGSGTITKIAFKKQTDRNATRKIKIYMQNTSKESFASTTDWVSVTEATDKVFEGEVDFSGANNDLEFILNTPFSYTGENLLISVCDYTGSYASSTYFYTYSVTARSLFARSDNTSYNPENMSGVTGKRENKNNIIDITIETVTPSEPETAPSTPTNLAATAESSTSIALTWDAVDGATSYKIYDNEDNLVASTENNAYTITELTPATNYCYTVTAVNAIGESEASEQKCAETPAEDAAFEGVVTIGGDVNSSNTSGNLPTNVNYKYTFSQQIYTKDEINVKAGTIGKIAFKQKGNQPNNPTRNLKVYMQNVQKTSFAKTSDWVSVTDSDKVFEGNVNLMGPGEDFVIELSKQFAYTGEGLLISVYDCTGNYTAAVAFYTYTADSRSLYVRNDNNPYDPANMSTTGTFPTVNNIIDLTFVAGSAEPTPELPNAPTNLVATAQSSTSIVLTWDAVDGATSYNVYDNEDNLVASTENNAYTITELSPATEYCYTVTAVNTNSESEASAPACAETESDNTGGDIEDDLNGEEHLVVIGDTKYSLNELPITTYYNYGYSQQIYTKDEIGINSGTITKIAFKQSNDAIYTRSNVVVYMQNTTKASYSSGSDWVNVTDDTKVFEGSLTTPGTNGNLEITLDTPLKYTGENLLISICDESGVWNSKSYFYIYDPSAYRSIYTVNDDTPYTSLNMNGSVSGSRDGYNNYIEITIMTAGSSTPETPEAPSAPQNLVATAQSSSSIVLTWNAVDGAESYNVYRASSQIASGITAPTFTDTDLESSATYCYTVKAVKGGVESLASNKSCAETEPEIPSAPTNLFASAQSATSIGLIWSSVYGAESYKVYRNSQEIATNVTGTSYTDNGLTANTYYCYTVKAVNSAGESEESSSACAMTYSLIPSTPTGLDVTAQSSSSIALTWNSVDGAESYKVYRDSQEIATNVTGTSYTDNGLTANTNYCYTVKAVNSAGESEESGSACAMTYPLAPTGLVATAESTTSIALTWNAVDGAISYNIYRNSTQIATGITVTSYTDNGLTPSTEYVYTVKAVNVAGESDASNEVRATTEAIVVDGIEQVVSIGNISNMTSAYLPFETYYTDSYSQQIYTKAEIESNGLMSGGTITKIAFKQKSNTVATRKLKVYMQNVSTASFTNDRAWVNVTDATKVFDGEVALSGAGDFVITLSLPLEYTGGNLLISVLDYTGTATNNTEFYTYGVSNRSIRFHNYGATINPSSMSSIWGTRDGVNNVIDITFVMPILEFVGDGDWSNASNWENGVVPNSNSNVAVSGNVTINSEVVVRTITIENGGSVTLESGSLTVKDDFTNTDASAFLIEDGTQVFQTNDDVKATFLMNVLAPESWAENHTHGWQFIASPMKESMTSAFETEGIDYDLFKYVGGMDEEWVNYKGHNGIDFEETFKQGRGYIVSYERQTMVEFEGTLNHETSFAFPEMSFNEEDDFANFYLLGNPFAFNINWNDVSANDLANGYAVVTFDGNYEYAIDGDINVGDGFFVQTIGAEPSLSYGVNTRGRNSKKNNFINIIATGRDGSDNVIINFTDNDEEGFAKLENINKDIAEIYVKGEGRRYGILNYENDVEEIELYFDAKRMGEYTISAVTEGEFQSVILVDKHTGVETDLTKGSYTFRALSSDHPDRFVIRMGNEVKNDNFVYQSGDELIVNAKGMVQIIDVMGRIAYSSDVVNDNHRINISTFNNAAYVVRVMNSNEVKTQKIVIAF